MLDLNELFQHFPTHIVDRLLSSGEGLQIEFKERLTTVLHLSRVVSAFANAKGGVVLVGIKENPPSVVGCDTAKLQKIVEQASERLKPIPDLRLHVVNYKGLDVGVIVIMPTANEVVVSDGGVFVRKGEDDLPMSAEEMQQRLAKDKPPEVTNQELRGMIDGLNQRLAKVHDDVRYPVSWRGRSIGLIVAFIAGFCAKIASEIVLSYFAVPPK